MTSSVDQQQLDIHVYDVIEVTRLRTTLKQNYSLVLFSSCTQATVTVVQKHDICRLTSKCKNNSKQNK